MESLKKNLSAKLLSRKNRFTGRIQWDLDTCTGCGSLQKRDSLFCLSCESLLLNYRTKNSLDENKQAPEDLRIFPVFSWNPGESDMLSALLLKIKNYRYLRPYYYWASQMVLTRNQNVESFEGDSIIISCPSKQLNQPDHAYRLAYCLSEITNFELQMPLRRVNSETQRKKNRRTRQKIYFENYENFTIKRPVIFVDDIVTTGSTARAAHQALGKPEKFEIWCLAYRQHLAASPLS